ncbi:regulatory-associated protein of mTOR-like [Hetaerina americana]|uniref:regulatory-associated protein of mTOR-like n=1 Tax=Hetaerina americana TaxID=62018 RepID=UPI003A7F5C96
MAAKAENHVGETEITECIDWKLPLSFMKKRHLENIEGASAITQTWRMKERMKTVSVALVLCLNVGVDPPDIVKTQPCARLECWIDPLSMSPQKALEAISSNLQKQYERWQPRARYKQSLDPTVEEVKKLCTSLRRNSKEERVLFHYNGHGVPRPTTNGEVWVFNRTYTQYIPLSVYDLQTWMGSPSIYVYDCSNAGIIVESFKQFADQHEKEYEQLASQNRGTITPPPSFKNCIQLAACAASQILPMNPDLPADIFTACLTTPIKIALRWFVMQNTSKLVPKVSMDLIDKIPGQLNDRRTMLGELNWIFTAITDTIAWNTLPRDLFQKLFRQDLLVASLFRNFLLAERIMRSYDCTPVSSPKLPPTYQHAMWQAWDLALDLCLSQLPGILEKDEHFVHSPFFEEQLTAFQVWLSLGSERRNPPEQLPIVLQVLLSQVHRLRALELLGRFLDLGPWAVNLALSVGIFPYVLKLLQSSARELRPLLVFIWAKILAVDSTCQADLVRENGHKYFLSVLQDPTILGEHRTLAAFVLASMVHGYPAGQAAALQGSLVSICLEQLQDNNALLRQWLAVCLGRLWANYDAAKWCGVRDIAHEKLYTLLTDPVPEVRAAAVYALGTFISSVTERSEHANNIDHSIAMTLINTVSQDMSPLVRKELVVSLQWMVIMFENAFVGVALQQQDEGKSPRDGMLSPQFPLVPEVTLTAVSGMKRIASRDRLKMLAPGSGLLPHLGVEAGSGPGGGGGVLDAAHPAVSSPVDRMKRVSSSSSISSLGLCSLGNLSSLSFGSIYMKLWTGLTAMDHDPHPEVAHMSKIVTDHIREQVKESTAPKEVNEAKMSSSVSLPPSPSSRPSFLAGESPPTGSATDLHRISARSSQLSSRARKNMPNTISEEADDAGGLRKPLVSTQFVEWSCKYFAQPVMKFLEDDDVESKQHYEREWRYMRNTHLRKEAKEEQKRLGCGSRIESQVFTARSPDPPSVIQFHPYDNHLVVAGRDCYGVWDWGGGFPGGSAGSSGAGSSGSRLMHCPSRGPRPGASRITAVEFANGHDVSLLLAASDDGSLRLWRDYASIYSPSLYSSSIHVAAFGSQIAQPKLVSAWQALSDISQPAMATKGVNGAGVVVSWDQLRQQVVVTGDVRVIRLWDAERELRLQDLPTGADSCVTGVSTDSGGGSLLVAGCGDGSVRLFDRRMGPQDSRVVTWREHSGWVVGAHLRTDLSSAGQVISGCVAGDVRFFDLRRNSSVSICQTSQGMTAMAVHPEADCFACGSVNQFISIYNMNGQLLNVIKYHEGFMSQRIKPVSCLAFHSHRVCLAAGSMDSAIGVYSLDFRR